MEVANLSTSRLCKKSGKAISSINVGCPRIGKLRCNHASSPSETAAVCSSTALNSSKSLRSTRSLHMVQHSAGELVRRCLTTHVACSGLALGDDIVDGLGDAVGVVVESQMPEHHASGEDQSGRVGLVLTLNIQTDVTAAWLEHGNFTTHVATRNDTWATDKASTNVGEDTSVQVGHDHDVELLWSADTLHAGVVDNHIVGLDGGVLLADLADGVAEETIRKLHDVGLVDASDLAAVVGQGEAESELGDALALGTGDDLEGLDDTRDRLMLQARVLALGVLTDNAQVDVLVARLVSGDVLDQDDGSVNVELLSESNVEGLVAGSVYGSVEDTLETELVALERGDGLAEELLGVLAALLHTRHIDLFPLDGHVVRFENCLDRFRDLGADTVTCVILVSQCLLLVSSYHM